MNTSPDLCPQGRISRSSKPGPDGIDVLDLSAYIPFFLTSVGNTLSRGAARLYPDRFGVGLIEWRVMAMIAVEPDITAKRICDVTSLDKSGVSRALSVLAEREWVECLHLSETDPRRRSWKLTKAGRELHERIMTVATERERRLIEGIDPIDLEIFLRVMRQISDNVVALG